MSDAQHTLEHQPAAGGKDVLRAHDFDGIVEYDNPIPLWLTSLFLATILFAMVYIPYYLLGYFMNFATPQIQLAREIDQVKAQRAAEEAARPPHVATEESLAALLSDPAALAAGKAAFKDRTCASCHGEAGQGLVGPNLTDNYWIHGAKLMDMRNTVVSGVLDKGMPTWGGIIPPDVIDQLVVYVRSLRGTNPPNPKPPQGQLVE